jgi:hypothetical protein
MLLQDRFHEFVDFILQTVLSRTCIARLLFWISHQDEDCCSTLKWFVRGCLQEYSTPADFVQINDYHYLA